MGGSERGDQSVLNGVSGLLPVAEGAQGNGPESIAVAPHELTESIRIPGDVLGEEVLVAGVGEPGVVQR